MVPLGCISLDTDTLAQPHLDPICDPLTLPKRLRYRKRSRPVGSASQEHRTMAASPVPHTLQTCRGPPVRQWQGCHLLGPRSCRFRHPSLSLRQEGLRRADPGVRSVEARDARPVSRAYSRRSPQGRHCGHHPNQEGPASGSAQAGAGSRPLPISRSAISANTSRCTASRRRCRTTG